MENKSLFLIVILLGFLIPGISAHVPASTNTNYMWVSDNSTDFWIMNNPSGGVKNGDSVFHYDSNFNLVEKYSVDNIYYNTEDFARLNSTRWIVLHHDKIWVHDQDWNYLKSKEIPEKTIGEDRIDPLSLVDNDGMDVIFERYDPYNEDSYYSYDLDPHSLELRNRTPIEDIKPDEYPPEEGEWVKFSQFHFKNTTETHRHAGNYTENRSVYAVDGHIGKGNIWLLEGSYGNPKIGGVVYRYTMDMNYTGESYSVGLNQSQIRETKSNSPYFTPSSLQILYPLALSLIIAILVTIFLVSKFS